MAWIKRNLYFVITVAVGLGLTGFCAYKLFSALNQNTADSEKYQSDKSSLETLRKKTPFPDRENILAADKDAKRVEAFKAEFQKPFAGFPEPPKLSDEDFKQYLVKTVNQFAVGASNAGVGIPAGYAFSFSQQMNVFNYPAESITPLMEQLTEIRAILRILYNAKINYLERIRRPTVTGEDLGGDDYLLMNTRSNTWKVATPYMITFRSFSSEIANVLAGFASSSNCYIVKTIDVEESKEPLPPLIDLLPTPAPAPMPMPMPQYRQPAAEAATANPFMQNNPFLQNNSRTPYQSRTRMEQPQMQYQQAYQQQPYQPPPPPAGPVTILTEMPLFVTMYIDVVKLKVPEKPAVAPSPAGRPSRRADR